MKYLFAFSIPIIGAFSLLQTDAWVWALTIYVFGLLPLLELVMKPSSQNMDKTAEQVAKKNRLYDILVWLMLPTQYLLLGVFLLQMRENANFDSALTWGKIMTMGILCGVLGINVAHELGHRSTKSEQFMAKMLLLTSLYMHFFIEHNRGHHKHVATKEDPATSRFGEIVFTFWMRSITLSYLSAWKLEAKRLQKKQQSIFSWRNEMLWFQMIQAAFLCVIYFFLGTNALIGFVISALIGALLLETVNYIEHYGLSRQQKENGQYEKVQVTHSWNSDHPIGRLVLFELSRHSDHHYEASRKYQVLRSLEESPQMPTGYPGMILLSLVPPLWFRVMHREIRRVREIERV